MSDGPDREGGSRRRGPEGRRETVLFICTHNSARSQMAEGLLNHTYGDRYEASSAGVEATEVRPLAIEVMREKGIDISGHRSKVIEEFRDRVFDYVVTVCDSARAACPFFPGRRNIHRAFPDPAAAEGSREERLEAFRRSRDGIMEWIGEYFG